jgi:hypothetical protein
MAKKKDSMMKGIDFHEMLNGIADIDKIAKALTPSEAIAKAEQEATFEGGVKKGTRKGALIGGLAGALYGSSKRGSGKVRVARGVWHGTAGAIWGGAAGAAGMAVKRKAMKPSKEEIMRNAEEILDKSASLAGAVAGRIARPAATVFTSPGGRKTIVNAGRTTGSRLAKASKAPKKSTLGHQFRMGGERKAGFFGGKVSTNSESWLHKDVGQFMKDLVQGRR